MNDYAYELRLRVVLGEDGPTAILELPDDWSPFLNDLAGQFVQEVTRRLRHSRVPEIDPT